VTFLVSDRAEFFDKPAVRLLPDDPGLDPYSSEQKSTASAGGRGRDP